MLNLVELGPAETPMEQLARHVKTVMDAVRSPYSLDRVLSEVYEVTVDVLVNGEEVASGAVGPHSLDKSFGITDAWTGVGFGIERLECLRNKSNNHGSISLPCLVPRRGIRISAIRMRWNKDKDPPCLLFFRSC